MNEDRYALVGPVDERVLLDRFLDEFRAALVRKVEGVSDDDAARPGVASGTSLLWLVQHMVLVEQNWFQRVLHGTDLERMWPTPEEALAEAMARYTEACAVSREKAAGLGLDHVAAHPERPYTLRWIMLHMIEETARHAGHADILREQLDGTTGE
ncbi:MAG TPA: DinB family protein [Acidimicrobiales bacterium]